MRAGLRHIAMVQGHPDPEGRHFGHALAQAYVKGASDGGHTVDLIEVARLNFPLLRSRKDQHGEAPLGIRQAQAAITRADHVMMIYPLWNGAAPALLKGFLEQTFRPAFIFPDTKTSEALGFLAYYTQRKALTGKTAHVVVTMQMPAFVYRWYFRPHPERNTLRLGGMGPIPESLIGSVETPDGRSRERWLGRMYESGREAR